MIYITKYTLIPLAFLLTTSIALSNDQDRALVLSADSLFVVNQDVNADRSLRNDSYSSEIVHSTDDLKPKESHTISSPVQQTSPHVLIVPSGQISSSFTSDIDPSFVHQLRNAINTTQLNYKSEEDFVPISTAQTVARIQNYLSVAVHAQLTECGIPNIVFEEDDSEETLDVDTSTGSFLYRIEVGANRLVITKNLLSTKLNGEASAKVIENNSSAKKISVNSYVFADKETVLENQQTDVLQKDLELKNVASKVVDRLGERLGKKLCQYFN